ncbi:glycosyltransferase family 4 protein [Chloroflexota bacterium]
MKLLFAVHQFFPKHYTGTERLVLNLSKQMQRMGHSVKVLTYDITETEGFRKDGDFFISEYHFQGVPVISIRHNTIPPDVSFSITDPSMVKIIGRIIPIKNFDIVHVAHPMRVGSVIKVAKNNNIPIILTLTDFWLICPKGIAITKNGELCYFSQNGTRCVRECYGNLWKDRLIKRSKEANEIFKDVDCVVTATNFLKKILKINNFASDVKIVRFGTDYRKVIPNVRKYSEKSEITLGFLSTLTPHKGAHVLLDAFNIAKMDNLRLEVYGHHFGDIAYYRKLGKAVTNEERVKFCGEYTYEEMTEIFNKIDVLVIPSIWWENSPLILLSALAHNVPVIVSNLGGMTEIIEEGTNGFTFEVGSAESLAKVLRTVGENPAILNELKTKICHPPMIEEEAFEYEKIYEMVKSRDG